MGMDWMSCASDRATVVCPVSVRAWWRSARACRAMAVDDSDRPKPSTRATCQPAPSHQDTLVSLDSASRYCQSQGAELPSASDMEIGETAGIYHEGIEVKPERLYHLRSKELYASERADGPRLRPNPNAQGSNAYYYCIRKKASRGKK